MGCRHRSTLARDPARTHTTLVRGLLLLTAVAAVISVTRVIGQTAPSGIASATAQVASQRLPLVSGPALTIYPPSARVAQIAGEVGLRVQTTGENTEHVEVTRSIPLLDAAASTLIGGWRFAEETPRAFDTTIAFEISRSANSCDHPG